MPLTISGLDAAGVPVNYTKTIHIDNQQPTVALSGPTDAPSTAGTQYVTASAAAGPSGVAGISCSADGAPARWYPGPAAQIPVDGVGQHQVQCFSENNAHDGNGTPGVSATRSFSVSIRVPTVAGIAFTSIADRLRCKRVKKRVEVPGRTVIVRRHHKLVRIRGRRHTKVVKVTKCHPRTILVHRIVVVTVRRHGKKVKVRRRKTIRVPVPPHAVLKLHRRVAFGHTTTVSGWLGTYDGVALGGETVEILSAPDNGSRAFTPVAWATTAANGAWNAQIPAGPSRLIEADYGGAANLEPSLSGQVTETVPAKVKLLSVSPRRVAWGGTVRITGQLVGGYLPPVGALVRLRIGQRRHVSDLWCAGARHRERAVHDDVPVRGWRPCGAPQLLVPDRDVADGRLSLRTGRVGAPVGAGRRAPALLPLRLVSNVTGDFERSVSRRRGEAAWCSHRPRLDTLEDGWVYPELQPSSWRWLSGKVAAAGMNSR